MILIIKTNKEHLHDNEFVKPIEKILRKDNLEFSTKYYLDVCDEDLTKANKVIISGTSLQDNDFLEHLNFFDWIKTYKKPLLGICAGMQIISLIFGARKKTEKEIGFYRENFTKDFLSLKGEHEVYHLHNNYCTLPKDFESYTDSKIPQAIKHKTKKIYGVLFHPEVRNEKLVINFVLS